MYLTYQEYQNMGGALPETAFTSLEFEAEALINWYTFNRLSKQQEIPEAVKRLMMYLISLAANHDGLLGVSQEGDNAGRSIASQSNDGVSISYNTFSAGELMQSIKTEAETAVKQYLQGIQNEADRLLLYRGVYPDE